MEERKFSQKKEKSTNKDKENKNNVINQGNKNWSFVESNKFNPPSSQIDEAKKKGRRWQNYQYEDWEKENILSNQIK